MNFAEKLKALRKKKGWTQREVAEKIGVSPRTYASYELEGREPKDIDKYYALAETFGVSRDYFIEASKNITRINIVDMFHGIGGTSDRDRNHKIAKNLTSELVTLFMERRLSSTVRDEIAKRVMDAYWEARKEDESCL